MFPEGRILDFVIVGVLALIVVGPKDLPILMRRVGQFMARMRAMAAEFRASFDEMARQSELDELRREVEAMRSGVVDFLEKPFSEVTQVLGDIHASLRSGEVQPPLPVSHPIDAEIPPMPEVAPAASLGPAAEAPSDDLAPAKAVT